MAFVIKYMRGAATGDDLNQAFAFIPQQARVSYEAESVH